MTIKCLNIQIQHITTDCEAENISEHEYHTRKESETSDNDDNTGTQTVQNVLHIQSKHKKSMALDPPPSTGRLNFDNFIKAALRA
ncbi:hypothetical protein AVEN_229452-1 [Araneus ventricosus]|uniref:Uncharacterized protein n=1 Tax=Araneus ventricosus TaxID=182803 RepID=A0A4Y2JLE0_ARAVE|nr:hypothetical protein AVEN_229452-1 [Araneus ventricosus]